ncbi:MAG: pyridoxamine 5'-phosphate oxidase [Candidatus Hydrogenedentales bacterium]
MPIDIQTEPIALFEKWFAEAKVHPQIEDATAMALATTDAVGQPNVRMVLLKDVIDGAFVFYTNVHSVKALELAANPRAALCFYWTPLLKQVRVQGAVATTTDAAADIYFATRPRESQLGAWAADQSRPLESREELIRRFDSAKAKYEGRDVPRPPYWSGYRLSPDSIEFWLGQPYRLHDRVRYTKASPTEWTAQRLYP